MQYRIHVPAVGCLLKAAASNPLRRAARGAPRQGKRVYVLYTALLATGMMLALYLLLGIWPFGGGTVVTGDLGGLYINFYAQLKRAFGGAAGFTYGFAKGLGGNLTALLAYYYASPYTLLYLLFPLRWFPVAASLAFMAKIVLSCVTFHVFIAYKFPGLCGRAVALSLCYGFMAYSFAYAQNPMWHDGLVMLPLVCLGIDRIVAGKPLTVYAVSLGVAIFSDFYIAFMICIFAVLYFLYGMLLQNTAGSAKTRCDVEHTPALGTALERTSRVKNTTWALPAWAPPCVRFAAGSLLAGGSCAALLLPALFNINQNKGALLAFQFSLQPLLPLRQLPERLLWGSFAPADMEGHLPFLYCGALALLLVGCYFISRAVPLREKLFSGGMLLVFLFSFWLKGPDTLWHALKEPVWFPARYSFIFCFFLLVLGGRALAAGAVRWRPLVAAGAVLAALLLVLLLFPLAISRSRLLLNGALLLGFIVLLLFLTKTRAGAVRQRVLTGALAAFAALELLAGAFYVSNQFDKYSLSDFQNFVDTAGETVDAIHAADTPSGYRIAENWFRTLNDPLLLGYAGMSHFASTQDGPAQSVLYNLGHRNYGGGGPYLGGGTAFADAVLGLRYLADTGARAAPAHWQNSDVQAPYTVWQNPYAMPMAFTVPTTAADGRATTWQQDMFAYQNDFAALLGAETPLFTPATGFTLYSKDGQVLPDVTLLAPEARFELVATHSGRHYAYFSTKDYQLVPLVVNGNATAPYFSPDYAGVVDLGWLEAGETATVWFLNNSEIRLNGVLFARLDEAVLQSLVDDAWANTGQPFALRDGAVQGVFDATAQRATLYTSVPYDENWRAEIYTYAPNGATVRSTVQPFMVMGGLLALPLTPGQNTVHLRFVPAGSAAGLAISVVCVVLLAAALCFEHRRRIRQIIKKRRQKCQ